MIESIEELFPAVTAKFMKRTDKWGHYVTSQDLAELLKLNHKSVKNMIVNNFEELASLTPANVIRFNPRKYLHGGRPENVYYLNEEQAFLLIALARPTKATIKAKKMMTQAIKATSHNYQLLQKYTDLLIYCATGLTAQQIKKQRHVKTALDGLTIKEQERYKQLENIAISLVGLNKTWDEVKGVLLLA